tara:strand:+ start:451 stop:936 length:486 start_codon:yes stop_codon:yes gene_type:complete
LRALSNKMTLKRNKKLFIELIIVLSQFIIILFHFIKVNLFTQKIIHEDIKLIDNIGTFLIVIGLIFIILSLKDLGNSISPMPKPKVKSKLVTKGIYSFIRHPMYYSLLIISLGFLMKSLTIYNLLLTILLTSIIIIKIKIEEVYLIKKYTNYISYKNRIKI